MTLERIASLPAPVHIEGAVGEYLRRLHSSLQEHLTMRPLDFQNLVDGFEYASTTHATTHSDGGDDEVSHDDLADYVANEHLLTAAIDHDALLNFVANEHLPGIDEDDMSSDSVAYVPTQQSVKAYVDAEVGGIVTVDYKWTDQDDGLHTGDTDLQTIIDETGSGFAWIDFSGNNYNTAVCEVTIDGGTPITIVSRDSATSVSFPIQYSTSLLVKFGVANGTHTVYYHAVWN